MAVVIDGRRMAQTLLERTTGQVELLKARGVDPALAVVLVGSDPASEVYIGRKIAEWNKAGIRSIEKRLQADADAAELLTLIDSMNAHSLVTGILVQPTLPNGMKVP